MDLEPTVGVPNFSANPLAWYAWHLRNHPEMYAGFRQIADQYRVVNPRRRVSADMICHVMRWQTGLHAVDDQFSVNNNLTPLYARLYMRQRPTANVSTRSSQLDDLGEESWQFLLGLLPTEAL